MQQRMTKAEAKAQGLKRYFSGKPCPNGHIADRYTSAGCVVCMAAWAAKWKKANPKKHADINRRHRETEGGRLYHNRKTAERAKANPARVAYAAAKRRAVKRRATPRWADEAAMKAIYKAARECGMEVDHIVPLAGVSVCGLHWEGNLQLLPVSDNRRKSNHFSNLE